MNLLYFFILINFFVAPVQIQGMNYHEADAVVVPSRVKTVSALITPCYRWPDTQKLLKFSMRQNRLEHSKFIKSDSQCRVSISSDSPEIFNYVDLHNSFKVNHTRGSREDCLNGDESCKNYFQLAYFNKQTSILQKRYEKTHQWREAYESVCTIFNKASPDMQKQMCILTQKNGSFDYLYEKMYSSAQWNALVKNVMNIYLEYTIDKESRARKIFEIWEQNCDFAFLYGLLVKHKKSIKNLGDDISTVSIESLHDLYLKKECHNDCINKAHVYHGHFPQTCLFLIAQWQKYPNCGFRTIKFSGNLKKLLSVDILNMDYSTPLYLKGNPDLELKLDYNKLKHAQNVSVFIDNCSHLLPQIIGKKVPSFNEHGMIIEGSQCGYGSEYKVAPLNLFSLNVKKNEFGHTLYSNRKRLDELKRIFPWLVGLGLIGGGLTYFITRYSDPQDDLKFFNALIQQVRVSINSLDKFIIKQATLFSLPNHPIVDIIKEENANQLGQAFPENYDLLVERVQEIKSFITRWDAIGSLTQGSLTHWLKGFVSAIWLSISYLSLNMLVYLHDLSPAFTLVINKDHVGKPVGYGT